MTIKEVEKLTGLTAKSIRLYESKGLVQIERDENNSYRDFTEENVKQLKFIKLMRYLDFSIQEIKELIEADDITVKTAMEKKLNEYSKAEETIKEKKFLCESIIEDFNKEKLDELVDEQIEFIEYTESEEYAEIKKTMKELEESTYKPVAAVVFETIVFLIPILVMILSAITEDYSNFNILIPCSLICTVIITLLWKRYFAKRKKKKKLQEKKNKGSILWIPGFIIIVASALVGAALLEFISTTIYEPDNYLFYQIGSTTTWIVMAIEITCVYFITDIIAKISKNDEWNNGAMGFARKHRKWLIIVGVVVLYVAITNITYVTKDEIIYYNWNHPLGVKYSYDDVTEVKAGYKGGLPNVKGEFYYKINVGDRWINFDSTTPNEEIGRYTDTYMEIDDFDKALIKYNPKKISSHDNEKYADLDERYIELFGRIIDRK